MHFQTNMQFLSNEIFQTAIFMSEITNNNNNNYYYYHYYYKYNNYYFLKIFNKNITIVVFQM